MTRQFNMVLDTKTICKLRCLKAQLDKRTFNELMEYFISLVEKQPAKEGEE